MAVWQRNINLNDSMRNEGGNVIQKNSTHDVTFTDLTHDAMGVAKIDGFPVFVKDALKGEKGQIKIIKVNKNFAFGKLLTLHEPSPFRKKPICEHFDTCGGCNIMHMNYEMQLSFKKHRVKETLKKISGISPPIGNTVAMNNPYYYRNKAIIPFGEQDGRVVAGLYKSRSHEIVDLRRCHIFPKIYSDIIRAVKALVIEHDIDVYEEETHDGLLRAIMLRHSESTGDISLTFIMTSGKLPKKEIIIQSIVERFPVISNINVNINQDKTNVLLSSKSKTLYGKDEMKDTLLGIEYTFNHRSFYQINPAQTEKLYRAAIDLADLKKTDTVIDSYCGIGTIGLTAAKHVKAVIGFDVVKDSIRSAQLNAKNNDIENARFIQGKAEDVLPDLKSEQVDVLFIDPPRKGCHKEFLDTVIAMGIPKVVYISCNVSTFARDTSILNAGGYKVTSVTPFDMFPQTSHIETLALLTK